MSLVRKAQRGNRRAFDSLWKRYAPTVQSILLTMVDGAEAEDLTQEVGIAAFQAVPSLKRLETRQLQNVEGDAGDPHSESREIRLRRVVRATVDEHHIA